MSISSASEPESSLITFTGSDSISASSSRFTETEIPANGSARGAVTTSVKTVASPTNGERRRGGGGGGIIRGRRLF